MEFISQSLLHKYEAIINEINKENENLQDLKEQLKQENNNIVVYNLVNYGKLEKLSHVDVKIFNNITELLNLYADDLDKSIFQDNLYKNCKYYLIEIYITKHLVEKLTKSDWIVIISVQSNNFHISKSVNLPRNLETIMEVIPLEEHTVDCIVEAYLINTKHELMIFKLDSVVIDISYHFHNYERRSKNTFSSILQLTKLYNKNLNANFLRDLTPLLYQFNVQVEKQKLIETFLNNSYHNLDVELFADLLNENKKDFTIQLGVHFNKIEIIFNRKDTIQIKAEFSDIHKLKKYFLIMFHEEKNPLKKIPGLMEVKNSSVLNVEDALTLYKRTRRLSSVLPL